MADLLQEGSGKPRIPYNDAVDEALCYGWIDSIVKGIDDKKYTQRFTPRKPKSNLSAMNRERVHRLLEQGKMTAAGLAAIEHVFDVDEQPTAPDNCAGHRAGAAGKTGRRGGTFRNFPTPTSESVSRSSRARGQRPEIFEQRLRLLS